MDARRRRLRTRGANGGGSTTKAARSATGARATRAAGNKRGKFGFSWRLAVSLRISLFYDIGFPWIFLGFSRANRDLSMGYTGFSSENFSFRFCPRGFYAEA